MTTATAEITDTQWQAILVRDRRADGRFVYGVITTGIFCRPSCPARRPNPDNVRIFPNGQTALQAGFRPCRRCHPFSSADSPVTDTVIELCRYIEQSHGLPTLKDLAAHCGWSRHHLQRQFKAVTGLSPRDYALAVRRRRLAVNLQHSGSISDAMQESGMESSSQLYTQGKQMLGMLPGQYRSGGTGVTIRFAIAECSLGSLLVAETAQGICAISLGDDPEPLLHEFQARFAHADLLPPDQAFDDKVARVIALIEDPRRNLSLPLDIRGTAFQQRVWQALQQIPPGTTLSYQELAEKIGQPGAARAVASACAANTLAVAIPCHRIVRRDGSLSGYRWGVERKRALLEREHEESECGKKQLR